MELNMKTRKLCNLFGGQRAFARACNLQERDVRRMAKEDSETRPAWNEKIKTGLEQKIKECSQALKDYT